MNYAILLSFFLVLPCTAFASAVPTACGDDPVEDVVSVGLARALVGHNGVDVCVGADAMKLAERSFLRHAHLACKEWDEQHQNQGELHGHMASLLSTHAHLECVGLSFRMPEGTHHVYAAALTKKLTGIAGTSMVRALGLDIHDFTKLLQDPGFYEAFRGSASLSAVRLYNVRTRVDEDKVCSLLEIVSCMPGVSSLGLYEVPLSQGGIEKLQMTPRMVQALSRCKVDTLIFDTLDVRGSGEAFCDYLTKAGHPRDIWVRTDMYCDARSHGRINLAIKGQDRAALHIKRAFYVQYPFGDPYARN
ncbi:MAG: hypothetical protein LCH26_00215 [Proteobacteria bacterium]|nr:hypothetical protein [Pseudomonadota bacterium]